ncbi:cellulase family glycosylhydrolase [Microvirga roseola]|uniref:cellulase family glycosylhydrolase n=1 Tax=Microvirga roseola TaxID=2883126 RepID=UPI0022A8521B|nr:cellulase family glycosylhydrolase [Microvirga roseola]
MIGSLSTSGNQIVDGAGRPVKISGVNWFGLESDRYAPDGLHARNYKAMIDQMAELGFNTIRLPFSNQLFDPASRPSGIDYSMNPDLAGLDGLQILDKIVEYAGRIGMRIILDHHRSSTGAGSSENGLWYNDQYSEQRWIADWTMLAQRYADNPAVIGADLHNEPHGPATWGGGGTLDWASAAERAGNAIHGVNPNWLIFVEGVDTYNGEHYWWGGNLMGVRDRPIQLNTANKLVYSAHDYPNSLFAQPWFSDPAFPNNLPAKFEQMWGYIYRDGIAPVYLGEFGSKLTDPKDLAWLAQIKAYLGGDFDANGTRDIPTGHEGIGWTWWSWNPNSGDTGGILKEDWSSIEQEKVDQLQPLLWSGRFPPVFVGTSGSDELSGTAQSDIMRGLHGSDKLIGGSGDDSIDGGSGVDTMSGGTGNDTFLADSKDTLILEAAGEGHDVVWADVSFALAAGSAVEELRASGKTLAVSLTGNAFANWVVGTTAGDTLNGGAGADTLAGGSGGDVYIVDNLSDRVLEAANSGNDTVLARSSFTLGSNVETLKAVAGIWGLQLRGNSLANEIAGNVRANTIFGKDGSDTLYGDGGNDKLYGGNGRDTQYGGLGRDSLDGGSANDRLYGDTGNDTLKGGTGNDLHYGGTGHDKAYGSSGNDRLYGDTGRDTLYGGSGSDRLYGGTGKNKLDGDSGNDKIYGGSHADRLYGGTGRDAIRGDAGHDSLYGESGNDTLYGGHGRDTFDTRPSSRNFDKIKDFNAADDTIRLARKVFKTVGDKGSLNESAFSVGTRAQDASDRIVYNPSTGALLFDQDGTGPTSAVRFAVLQTDLRITHRDFHII